MLLRTVHYYVWYAVHYRFQNGGDDDDDHNVTNAIVNLGL